MKKLLRWTLRLFLLLALIIGAAWLIENYRGYKAWEETKARATKLGVSLDLADYAAPTIPDSQNLLKNPDFSREWNGEIEPPLKAWASMELNVPNPEKLYSRTGEITDYLPVYPGESNPDVAVDRLTEAAHKVEARLNSLAETILASPPQDLSSRFENAADIFNSVKETQSLQRIARAFHDQAILSLHRNDPGLALRNCQAIERLAQNDKLPGMMNFLGFSFCHSIIPAIIWEGILLGIWETEQLNELSDLLETEVDHLYLADILSYEAAVIPPSVDQSRKIKEASDKHFREAFGGGPEEQPSTKEQIQLWIFSSGPKGWDHQRKSIPINSILDLVESSSTWKWEGSPEPEKVDSSDTNLSFDPFGPYRDTKKLLSKMIQGSFEITARARICLLAMEIEKNRLTNGILPKSLDEIPDAQKTTDPCDPQKRPFKYELLPEGGFQIYSKFFYEREPDVDRKRFLWKFPTKH